MLDLRIDDQDHTAQRLRDGEVLAAVTASRTSIAGCNSWPLGSMAYVAAASPGFAARHWPQGASAEALAAAPMLSFGPKDRLQEQWLQAQGLPARAHPPRHYVPSNDGYVRGCNTAWAGACTVALIEAMRRAGSSWCRCALVVPLFSVHLRSAQAQLDD